MIIRFKTKSGSKYQIDYEARVWECFYAGVKSKIRIDTGVFFNNPIVKLGERVVILGPALQEGMFGRFISTSPVQSFEQFYNENELKEALSDVG